MASSNRRISWGSRSHSPGSVSSMMSAIGRLGGYGMKARSCTHHTGHIKVHIPLPVSRIQDASTSTKTLYAPRTISPSPSRADALASSRTWHWSSRSRPTSRSWRPNLRRRRTTRHPQEVVVGPSPSPSLGPCSRSLVMRATRACTSTAPRDNPSPVGVGVCPVGSITSIPLQGVGVFSGSYTRHYSMTDSHSVRAAYEVLTFT